MPKILQLYMPTKYDVQSWWDVQEQYLAELQQKYIAYMPQWLCNIEACTVFHGGNLIWQSLIFAHNICDREYSPL